MASQPEALSASVSLPVPDDTGQDSPAPHAQARERTRADPREPGYSRADLEYAPPDPEHEALAASLPQEWVKAAEGWYSMHGSGLVRNLLAGAVPLIVTAERERDAEARTACEAQIASLERHLNTLAREHARHSLAVSAHKARADQQESRAICAEKQLARFARHAGEYDGLAAQAAQGMRNADLVTELRRRIAILERWRERAERAEAKLAEVRARCQEARQIADLITDAGGRPVKASPLIDAILAITGTGEEPS